jgi:hypothetical protein
MAFAGELAGTLQLLAEGDDRHCGFRRGHVWLLCLS